MLDGLTDTRRFTAAVKSSNSTLAGWCAGIMLVPTLEAGNMHVKELTFSADADAAGIALERARAHYFSVGSADQCNTGAVK